MTIEEIVEREVASFHPPCESLEAKGRHCTEHETRRYLGRNLALAVARAVIEEAAHACERIPVASYHCTEAVALRIAAFKIRALLGGGK